MKDWQPQFKMGIGDLFGEATGFGSNGNPDPHNLDDAAYEDYYQKALSGIQSSGSGTNSAGVQDALNGQLSGLDNNMAGRKKAFGEDMSRSFGNDVQQKARASGGTGNLAQSMSTSGGQYDSEARQASRGYNDLYSQGTKDLSTLSGVQSNLNNQDFQRANASANLDMNRINQRMGVAQQNAQNSFNSDQIGAQRRIGTEQGVANMIGNSSGSGGGGSSGFHKGGKVPKSNRPKMSGGGIMGMLDPLGLTGGGGGGGGGGGSGGGGGASSMMSMLPMLAMAMNKGGKVPHLDSGGGMMDSIMKLAPLALMMLNEGGEGAGADARAGGRVPGKAKVKGDSPKNDTFQADLSPDEVVIPRSITTSKDPVRKGAKFLNETINEGKHRHKDPKYFVGGADVDSNAGPMPGEGGDEEEEGAPTTDQGSQGGGKEKQQPSMMDDINGIFQNSLNATKNAVRQPEGKVQSGKATGMARGGQLDAMARKMLAGGKKKKGSY